MNLTDAILARTSIRAFLPEQVPLPVIKQILQTAGRAPSGGNLQPWRIFVLTGEPLAALKRHTMENPEGEQPEYDVYPPNLWEPLRTRRFEVGEALYATLKIPREDRPGRLRQLAQNGQFFGAPVGLFFCLPRKAGPPQWADAGMLMQTIMLLAVEQGLATCAQEYWARYPRAVAQAINLPEDHMLFSGMALGYADTSAPINSLRTSRATIEEWAEFIGFS